MCLERGEGGRKVANLAASAPIKVLEDADKEVI